MASWYWLRGEETNGPCSMANIQELVRGGTITPSTLVWQEGTPDWVPALTLQGLFPPGTQASPTASPPFHSSSDSQDLPNVVGETKRVFTDLTEIDFRKEVFPLDNALFNALITDFVFWSVTVLSVVPLLIVTLTQSDYQLIAFALFFAILWGVIFKYFIVRSATGWPILIGSLFATGIAGIYILLSIYEHVLPDFYLGLVQSENAGSQLLGFVFQVGLCEELCKAAPVIGYLIWKRKDADPMTAVLVGLFSGLGFAAFENIDYGERSVLLSFALTEEYGADGLEFGVQSAMVVAMVRSLSLVFCHAVWSGIFAYFLAVANWTGRRRGALAIVGLAVAAILHGVYDWLQGIQPTFAALIVVISCMLFYAYMSNLRKLLDGSTEATA